MARDGGMRPRSMAPTRRSTTGSFAGPAWASSTESSPTLRPKASQATVARNILQDFVSTAPQGREYVRKAKRLAAYLNALRPLRSHILQRYLPRGNRYLLARSMSPDPSALRSLLLAIASFLAFRHCVLP